MAIVTEGGEYEPPFLYVMKHQTENSNLTICKRIKQGPRTLKDVNDRKRREFNRKLIIRKRIKWPPKTLKDEEGDDS